MNSITKLNRIRLPFHKDFLRPKAACGQIIPNFQYSSSKVPEDVHKPKGLITNASKTSTREPEIPQNVHPLAEKYISTHQKENGEVYDTKPFKIRLKPNKEYFWCLCGRSHSQPLCDGNHRDAYRKTPLRPVRFQVKEDKEYWLCNCKHTKLRPFCDGTHKTLPPKKR